jgi:acyl-CoA synthetase (AMP-forming)/AMP-acid ligase II
VDPKDHDRLLPIGAVGELVIQGEIVGRGYLNEPKKTSAVFISNPKWAQNSTQGCGRMYKTGHLVGYDDVGCLIYIGREDNQVNLRGQLSVGTVWRHEKVGRIVMVFKCLREESIYNVGASLHRLAPTL